MKSSIKRTVAWLLAVALLMIPGFAQAGTAQGANASGVSELKSVNQAELTKTIQALKSLKAGSDYVSDEVLAEAASLQEAQRIAVELNAEVKSYAPYGLAVLKLKQGGALQAMEKYSRISSLAANISPNFICRASDTAQYTPTDPHFSNQYFHEAIDDEDAWSLTRGSAGVVVAVIDTGIDISHPEFKGKISAYSYNSSQKKTGIAYVNDDYGHGTHVAGIVAALQNNGKGGCGTAPGITLMAIKANAYNTDSFSTSSLVEAIRYAADHGADIINMSLGRAYTVGASSPEHQAIQYAVKKGVLVVCAAGNRSATHADWPSAYDECVTVSAMRAGNIFDTTYSNRGPEVDIAAPGSQIYSTYPDNTYTYMTGTSMATPMVCGVAALVKSKNPGLSVNELKQKLYQTAVDRGEPGRDDEYGFGAVNAYNALAARLCKVTLKLQGGTGATSMTRDGGQDPEQARRACKKRI